MNDTRAALQEIRRSPWRATRAWIAASLLIAGVLLASALSISVFAAPTEIFYPIVTDPDADLEDLGYLLLRNGTVLLLHLLVCFATYLARRSLPLQAPELRGVNRWVHAHASTWALAFVAGATVFSLVVQAWSLGHDLSSAAHTLQMSEPALLGRLLVHGLPELTAVFVPLAATLVLVRAGRENALLAAMLATTCMAVPVLIATAAAEVWLTRILF